ncbi:MAG: ABC transporter ATP-binding protein, partial [Planctomycetota bacterium]
TSGAVSVEGNDLLAMTEAQKTSWRTRSIGYVFQYRNLLPVLKANENVELPLLLLPLSKKERREHVAAALEAVGLTDRADHYPRQMSGGEELRVAIARGIVTDARILLADEPTGSLDAVAAEGIMELLARLNSEFGKTVVVVTHDAKAAGCAGRMLRMEKGHLVHGDKEVDANAV